MSMTSITLSLRPLRLCASKDSVARVMATKSTVKKSKKKDDYFSNSENKGITVNIIPIYQLDIQEDCTTVV